MTKRLLPRWVTAIIGIFVVALILAIASNVIPIYRQLGFICENTGSRKGYYEWIFRIRTSDWYQRSALESFLLTEYPTELQHKWTSYEGTGYNIYGKTVLRGHGRPGRILFVSEDALNRYVDSLSPAAKLDLYRLFVSGDQVKIDNEITLIWERAIELKCGIQPTNATYSQPQTVEKR